MSLARQHSKLAIAAVVTVVLIVAGYLALNELRRQVGAIEFTDTADCSRNDVAAGARALLGRTELVSGTKGSTTTYLESFRIGGPWYISPDTSGMSGLRAGPSQASVVATDPDLGLSLLRAGTGSGAPDVRWAGALTAGTRAYLVTPDVIPCPYRVYEVTIGSPTAGGIGVDVSIGAARPGAVVLLPDGQVAGMVTSVSAGAGRVTVAPASRISEFVRRYAR